jgi:two-component system, LytTR family, sensor kinase
MAAVLTRKQLWTIGMLAGLVIGLLSLSYKYLDYVATGRHRPFGEPLLEELTGAYGVVVLLPLLIWCARRFRLDSGGWLRNVPVHLGALAAFSFAHTTWNWVTRMVLFPVFGMGAYDYGIMRVRYAMELPNDVIIYVLVVGIVHLVDRFRAARERDLRSAQLEARLVRAQLTNLQAQLHPHFLFNALNAISSVMYEDVRKADHLLSRLSDLLRQALQATRADEVELAEELNVLAPYVELMRVRFGERLRVDVDVPEAVRGARVPVWVLQPLVENATIHGMPAPPAVAYVRVRARRDGDTLVLEVEDNGPGLARPDDPLLDSGIGLSNTVERLRGLYGDGGRLEWRNVPTGGLLVTVRLPYREGAFAGSPNEDLAWSASAS